MKKSKDICIPSKYDLHNSDYVMLKLEVIKVDVDFLPSAV